MTNEQLKDLADKYEQLDKAETLYREDLYDEIDKIKEEIGRSRHKDIYRLIYHPTFGDYREFVESVAAELRKR